MNPHIGFLLSRTIILLEYLTGSFIRTGDIPFKKVFHHCLVYRLHVIQSAVDAPVCKCGAFHRCSHLFPFFFLSVQRHRIDVLLIHHICYGCRGCRTVLYKRGKELLREQSKPHRFPQSIFSANAFLIDFDTAYLWRDDFKFSTDILPADPFHHAATSWTDLVSLICFAQHVS